MVESDGVSSEAADTSAAPAAPSPTPAPSQPIPASEPTQAPTGDKSAKDSLLDAVLKVVPATNETDVLAATKDAPAPQGEDSPDSDQAETEAKTDDDEGAEADASPRVRKKIRKLLDERKALRQEVETLRPVAQIGGELHQFATANDLSGDDVTNVLRMAAMLRAGDYESFYRAVSPFVRTAQEYLGVVLPSDLAARVRAGHMTEPAAKEYARQRYDHQRSQIELESTQVAMSRQQVQSSQAEVQRAVTQYEHRLSASDPDYKAKAPSVRRAVQAILFERGGHIQNAQEALQITQAAYAEVNKQLRSFQPRPTATRPAPNGASQTTSARAAPKTLMEAALQGLDNARRAGG